METEHAQLWGEAPTEVRAAPADQKEKVYCTTTTSENGQNGAEIRTWLMGRSIMCSHHSGGGAMAVFRGALETPSAD